MPKNPPPKPSPAKSDRTFISILAVVLLIGVAAIGYVLFKPKPPAVVITAPVAPLPNAKGKVMGSDSALVEIVMFGDFECPGCGQWAEFMEPEVRERIVVPGLARFRFADLPLSMHLNTMVAHNAAACADAQGKFWPMHDRIYATRMDWSMYSGKRNFDVPKFMKRLAASLGVDAPAFDKCLDGQERQADVQANVESFKKLGLPLGTPTFVVGKRALAAGGPTYAVLRAYVDSAIADAKSGR